MAGTLSGTTNWFNVYHQPPKYGPSSAHYGVNDYGLVHQYVALEDTAYANGFREPGNVWPGAANLPVNHQTVSIETEDFGDNNHPVTSQQYATVKNLCHKIKGRFPTIKYMVTHRSISPLSRPICPGARWATRLQSLADEVGLTLIR